LVYAPRRGIGGSFYANGYQAVEILERAEQGIDGAVIRDIVAGVGLGRAIEGGQP
jgi:hypothetical protein